MCAISTVQTRRPCCRMPLARVCTVRDLAVSTANGMRQQGLRVWTVEMAQAIQVAAIAQARLLDLTVRRSLADAADQTRKGAELARRKASQVSTASREVVAQKSFQATAGSAVGGAIAMGTGGGATGLAAGGAVGALAGIPFDLFTFGLSVPIGAAIGGSAGLVAGATAGATAGAVGGGAAGYGVYAKKDAIAGAARSVACKAGETASRVRETAGETAGYVRDTAGATASRVGQTLESTKRTASVLRARVTGGAGKAERVEIRAN